MAKQILVYWRFWADDVMAPACCAANFGAMLIARSGIDLGLYGWLLLVTVEIMLLPPMYS